MYNCTCTQGLCVEHSNMGQGQLDLSESVPDGQALIQ